MFESEEKAFIEMVDNTLLDIIYNFHGYGFQDGGCGMFATAVSKVLTNLSITNKICVVGREGIQDHFIVKIVTVSGDMYIDSEGFHSKEETISKQHQNYPRQQLLSEIGVRVCNEDFVLNDEIEIIGETVSELVKAFDKSKINFIKDIAVKSNDLPLLVLDFENSPNEDDLLYMSNMKI